MTQEQRTELMREIKELLMMHYKYGKVLKEETVIRLESLLQKMISMSLL
jgi:hypothetical protein